MITLERTEPFAACEYALDGLLADGCLADAKELIETTLRREDGGDIVVVARLRLKLSTVLFALGCPRQAVHEADVVAAAPNLPSSLYAAAQQARLVGLLADEDYAGARLSATGILAGEDGMGDDAALDGALAAMAFIAWSEGRIADALTMFRAAVERAGVDVQVVRPVHAQLGYALALAALGSFGESHRAIARGEAAARLAGDTLWGCATDSARGRVHLAAGSLDDAVACAGAAYAAADRAGARAFQPNALATLATAALLQGQVTEARAHLRRCPTGPAAPQMFGRSRWTWIDARVTGAEGSMAGAAEILASVYACPTEHRGLLIEEPAAGAWLVRVALAAGARASAEAVAVCLEQLAMENASFPTVVASTRHARGVLDRDRDALAAAVRLHRQPWARGSAAEDAAVVLSEQGDVAEARSLLELALVSYRLGGAVRDTARVERRRARLDTVRPGRRGRTGARRPRPVSGWASLTETEVRVAAVVAQGFTNAETAGRVFMSRHTVDFHLRHIFRKLEIRSRVELARLAPRDLHEL